MNSFFVKPVIRWQSPKGFCEETLSLVKGEKVLLLISQSAATRMRLTDWILQIGNCSSVTWIKDIPQNPTRLDLFNLMIDLEHEKPNAVLAIGGGSTIDLAKALVAFLYIKEFSHFSYEDFVSSITRKEYLDKKTSIPIYAVPTTAGTGSEATKWATIWDENCNNKYSIEAPWLFPTISYVIPEFTSSMPPRLTLATGLDALCHAVEAYWSKASNPVIRETSKTSIRLIKEFLPKAIKEGDNLEYRTKMCLGSLFAGIAFSNTRTTACHSISYPLTMRFGMDHGFACAVSLAKVLDYNLPYIKDANELFDALHICSSDELQSWLDNISDGIVRLRLNTFGVNEDNVKELTKLSFTQGRMDNNPAVFKQVDIEKLLLSILK